MTARVTEIHTYPVKGEPGTDLEVSLVDPEGLAGDRRKKSPLHVVAQADADAVRANIVVDIDPDDLAAHVGRRLAVGTVLIAVTGAAGNCPGVYAEVVHAGSIHVGDVVAAADNSAVSGSRSPSRTPVDGRDRQG